MVATSTGGRWAAALAVLVVAVPAALFAPAAGAVPVASGAVAAGPCSVVLATSAVGGTLAIDGGPLGPAAASEVHLFLNYSASWVRVDVSRNVEVGTGCGAFSIGAVTLANGTFSATLSTPSRTCAASGGDTICTTFGPALGPVSVAPAGGPPSGYAVALRAGPSPGQLAVAYVWELSSVAITPSHGSIVFVSTGAPSAFTAVGLMENGAPTPLAPTFAWDLSGPGWSFLTAPSGSTVEVLAAPGAGLGALSVRATASSGTTALAATSAPVQLVAVPTAVERAELAPTSVDAGAPVAVTLVASGAPGYIYQAEVAPGLGVPAQALACNSTASVGGPISLDCSGSLSYPTPGVAQPTVTVTNGWSQAVWRFPNVTVSAAPTIVLAGGVPAGYPGPPVPLRFSVVNGTGVRPFAQGCLASGVGRPVCLPGPGPEWSFAPSYPTPGVYPAVAWAVDAAGENASVTTNVTIVPALGLGPLTTGSSNLTAGVPATFAANLSGGDLPVRIWWNASGSAAPFRTETVDQAGVVSATFLPGAAGVVVISVTAEDALGTVVRTEALVTVAPAPATVLEPWLAPPGGTVVVGAEAPLAWAALDREGNPVRSFAPVAEVTVVGPAGPPRVAVNASGVGALAAAPGGAFVVPSSAWVGGILELRVVAAVPGSYSVGLSGTGLPSAPAAESFVAVADLAHVRLFAPQVARHDARSNATFWFVADRFGNPVPGADLAIRSVFGATTSVVVAVAAALPNGSSGVWINYSAPGADAGTVVVVDEAGVIVLGPLPVAAALPPTTPAAAMVAAFAAGPAGAAAVGVAAFLVRRRRRAASVARTAETELRTLAEGREAVVELLRRLGPCDLAALERAWEPLPAPPEIADWLASLVADGTLGATIGPDRVARFRLAHGSALPQVRLDASLLEEALRRREESDGGPV